MDVSLFFHNFLVKMGTPMIGMYIGDCKEDLLKFIQSHIRSEDVKNPEYVAKEYSCDHISDQEKKLLDDCKSLPKTSAYCGECGVEKEVIVEPEGPEIKKEFFFKGLTIIVDKKEIKRYGSSTSIERDAKFMAETFVLSESHYNRSWRDLQISVNGGFVLVCTRDKYDHASIYILYEEGETIVNEKSLADIKSFSDSMKDLYPEYKTVITCY
jgi:hypothetical protein